MSILVFILIVSCAHFLGRLALRYFPISHDITPTRAYLLSNALGMIILSAIAFFLLVLNIGYHYIFAAIIYIFGIFGLIIYYRSIYNAFYIFATIAFNRRKPLLNILAFSICFTLLLTFYITLAPTTAWDGLAYHYPLPYKWLNAHSFYNIPEIIYSNFPSSAELIFIYGFAAHSDIVANHLSWYAGFLCILYLLDIGHRYFTPKASLATSIFLLSYPVVYIEELQGGYIDLIQAFYILALIDTIHSWALTPSKHNILLPSLLSGFILCIKHSGYLTFLFVILYILYLFLICKEQRRYYIIGLFVYIFVSIILPLGWYIKSFIYTANPIYPFMYHIFGGTYSTAPDIMYWANPEPLIGILQTVFYPFRATYDVSLVQLPFRLLPPFLIGTIPFILFKLRRSQFSTLILSYSVFFVLIISIIEPGEPRYNIAAWLFIALIASDALFIFYRPNSILSKYILPILILFPLAFGTVDISRKYTNYRHNYILHKISKTEYYKGNTFTKPLDSYHILNWVNNNLHNQDKVLLAEPRVFPINDNINYIIAYPFQTETIWDWDKVNITDIPSLLKDYGITNIAITYGPNYRGICEAWFIFNNLTQVYTENPQVISNERSISMGNEHFMRLAGYSNPYIDYITQYNKPSILIYNPRFNDIFQLFNSNGNVDVKMAISVMWCAKFGFINKVYEDHSGAIFKVIY